MLGRGRTHSTCLIGGQTVQLIVLSNCTTLPGFTYVFREVMTNSPNSCPTEGLFNIFNVTYNDDQKKSYTDYIDTTMSFRLKYSDLDIFFVHSHVSIRMSHPPSQKNKKNLYVLKDSEPAMNFEEGTR
jgi:hypothetical protein